MSDLQEMTLEHNPFVHHFKQAQENMREEPEQQNLHMHLTYKAHNDPHHYKMKLLSSFLVMAPLRENAETLYCARKMVVSKESVTLI